MRHVFADRSRLLYWEQLCLSPRSIHLSTLLSCFRWRIDFDLARASEEVERLYPSIVSIDENALIDQEAYVILCAPLCKP
jgi:hypothetical protein